MLLVYLVPRDLDVGKQSETREAKVGLKNRRNKMVGTEEQVPKE